jgi:hypothetical protein
MSQADFWYIRFPDGRVLRAASTIVLRQELSARRIPLSSTVRRSPNEEWVALGWMQEFADLVEELASRSPPNESPVSPSTNAPFAKAQAEPRRPASAAFDQPATVGSRVDPARLHFVGVRGYLGELLAALDSTLVLKKLLLGAIAGLLLGALLVLGRAAWFEQDSRWLAAAWQMLAVCLIVFDALASLLTRLTYIELARLRPARWRDGFKGLGLLTLRVVISQAVVGGIVCGLIVLLRWLPVWLGPAAEQSWSKSQEIAAGGALALGMILEALLWPILVFWCQLPPLLVVEDCSVWTGLRRWLDFINRHLGRVFLYQAMAVGLGVLVTAPFLLLIAPFFLPSFSPPQELQEAAAGTRYLLVGLACAPMVTYWITANVFIYLNLRYGASNRR